MINRPSRCWFCDLGTIEYRQAFALQEKLVTLRHNDFIDDILLILEHPPTITLGRFGKMENVLDTEQGLIEKGISLHRSNRGGDVTLHCPGQLVVYPIMDMRQQGGNLRNFLFNLEEVVLKTLATYSIAAQRWDKHPGIWSEGKQIAAIGLHFKRGISMHGVSLNVCPELASFNLINLCGIAGKKATSMAELLSSDQDIEQVIPTMLDSFSSVFKVEMEQISKEQIMEDVLGEKAS